MTGRTHDLAALTALGAVVMVVPQHPVTLGTVLVALVANQLGGIAPDIDEPTAPLWRNLPVGTFFGKIIGKMLGGHRFLTHSIVGAALFGWLLHVLLGLLGPIMHTVDPHLVWWAFMIGLISHLIMDTFTKEGVPWLLPIPIKFGLPPVRAWRVTTGQGVESFIIFPGLALIDIWWGVAHYDRLAAWLHLIVK
ncbi:metal-dependent hydrolase [Candidatus Saccharibacteria bacterium]|nr:metal-dependent hydrolase [Candidatus Saccharibacteria bacterium]